MDPTQLPLRDIHLPEPVSWWPPAPGWWLLAIVVVVVSVLIIIRWRKQRALRRSPAYLVHLELQRIKTAWQGHQNSANLLRDISSWLRRAAMSLRGREQTASVTGERWWQLLDELAGSHIFSSGGYRLLADAVYRPAATLDEKELLQLCDRWSEQLLRRQAGASTG